MFERFNEKKLDDLRMRYRGDDLFRKWAPILCTLEDHMGELDAVEIWSETENIRQSLYDIKEHRDNEVEFLFSRLKKRHLLWRDAAKDQERNPEQGEYTALTILTVLFSQFSDAGLEGNEIGIEKNPNKASCNVLAHVLMDPKHRKYVNFLMEKFKQKKTDNDGNKIILPVIDYMNIKSPRELMDEDAKLQIESMVGEIAKQTEGLKIHLNIEWEEYLEIWRDICSIPEIMPLLQYKQPKSSYNKWGKNLKLVANIIGIMKSISIGDKEIISGSDLEISNSFKSNVRAYISNHKQHGSNYTTLNIELHKKISKLIADKFS